VAILKCTECGKTVITQAGEVGAKPCPFCGGATRVREAPPPVVEAVQTERRPAPPPVAGPSLPRPDKKPAEGQKPDVPPRRRRRKRKKRPESWGETFDYTTIIYLASTGVVLFFWLVLIAVSLITVYHLGVPIIWYGAAVFLTGMIWLYIGALRDMDLPAIGPGMGGAGMALVLGGCAVLLIRILVILAYGVLYTVSNPYAAWKAAILTVLGILMMISGLFFLHP
jgi:hypothetical protein